MNTESKTTPAEAEIDDWISEGQTPEFWANWALDWAMIKRTKRPFLLPHIKWATEQALEAERAKAK